jgi:transcriptional regulator with XRE-family HTH domain
MTPLGAKIRKMRQERDIPLKKMAADLNVSAAYLSALEHGHRGTPTWFMLQRIIAYFNVIWDEAEELQRLAEISNPKITIDTSGMDPKATELTNKLARNIESLEEDDLSHLILEIEQRGARARSKKN